jgi:hypothetical protein
MDASDASILARLTRHRAELKEAIDQLDRAIADCRDAKREAIETLDELDCVLGGHDRNSGRTG